MHGFRRSEAATESLYRIQQAGRHGNSPLSHSLDPERSVASDLYRELLPSICTIASGSVCIQ